MDYAASLTVSDRNNDRITSRYSRPMVLESAAGFYIGTLYCAAGFDRKTNEPKDPKNVEPASRDSMGYYPTREIAEAVLHDGEY